jgi:acyl carrier protein
MGPLPPLQATSRRVCVQHLESVKDILAEVLSLGSRKALLQANTPLLGSIPEFDSMAVISVITALEEHFGIVINDDEVSADTFVTLGSLCAFVEHKLSG